MIRCPRCGSTQFFYGYPLAGRQYGVYEHGEWLDTDNTIERNSKKTDCECGACGRTWRTTKTLKVGLPQEEK